MASTPFETVSKPFRTTIEGEAGVDGNRTHGEFDLTYLLGGIFHVLSVIGHIIGHLFVPFSATKIIPDFQFSTNHGNSRNLGILDQRRMRS